MICSHSYAQTSSETSQISIKTDPPGAMITCDGKKRNVSPLTISGLSAGKHIITAKKKGFEPACIGIKLDKDQHAMRELKLEPTLGLLLIHAEPEDVDVKIDGADKGRAPLLITDLPMGTYEAVLSKPGYQTKTIKFTLKNRTPMKISEDLTSDSADLEINSEPSGATVLINGISRGSTPLSLEKVPTGTVKLELKMDGYQAYNREIRLTAGQSEVITGTLIGLPASLEIFSLPEKARIYVNNQFKGTAPVSLKNLNPGDYRVRAELNGFDPVARTITLENGAKKNEEFRLDGNCGRLEIVTQPAGVSVFIDDKPIGSTTVKKDQTDRVSNPLIVPLIRAGEHVVKLSSKKHYNISLKVTITEGKTTLIQKALRRRFIPDIEIRTRTNIIRGVLLEEDPIGNLKIEVAPGVIKSIKFSDVRKKTPIRSNTPEQN